MHHSYTVFPYKTSPCAVPKLITRSAAMAFGARAFQLILDVVKRWWLQGFADMLVDGQLALTCAPVRAPSPTWFVSLTTCREHQSRGAPHAHISVYLSNTAP